MYIYIVFNPKLIENIFVCVHIYVYIYIYIYIYLEYVVTVELKIVLGL